jgi:hypothetical protein
MQTAYTIETELKKAFTAKQSTILSKVIFKAHSELVKADDFHELKDIVKELAEAQKGTEQRVEELAEAQKETQKEIKILAKGMEELRGEVGILAKGLNLTRKDLGGVMSTLGYMLENEAYRVLPDILKERYGIEVVEKFLRRSIKSLGINKEGEINIYSRGLCKGKEITIIGEARSQLGMDDIDDINDLSDKLEELHKGNKFLIAVTHYARESAIKYGKEKGVEIIQSFEW